MTVRKLLALVAMVLLVGACGAGGTSDDAADAGGEEVQGSAAVAEAEGGGGLGTVSQGALSDNENAADDTAADPDAAAAQEPPIGELPEPPAVRTGDRVIKEGTVSIEVEQGQFDESFIAVVSTARRYGGDAVGSSTRTTEDGDTFGSVTVRVPVENFEDLLVGVGKIGAVRTRDVDSQDVSAEYTDLESRLRHLEARERFYLGLFDRANSVQDAITVQQQLDGIQAQIEKIEGRRNFLDDRTTFSTLTVELFEPEAGGELVTPDDPATGRPSLAHYWDTARDAFVNVVGALLVAVMFLLPLLVPLAVVVALWLGYRRPRRQAAPPPAPGHGDEKQERVSAGR